MKFYTRVTNLFYALSTISSGTLADRGVVSLDAPDILRLQLHRGKVRRQKPEDATRPARSSDRGKRLSGHEPKDKAQKKTKAKILTQFARRNAKLRCHHFPFPHPFRAIFSQILIYTHIL